MMMKKYSYYMVILVITFVTIVSCNSQASGQKKDAGLQRKNHDSVEKETGRYKKNNIKYYFYKDPKNGMVESKYPLPASWMVNENPDAEIYIKGPHHIKVNKTRTENYMYANDPFALQTIRQMGHRISPVVPLLTIVQQHVKPSAEAQGYTYIKSEPLPGVVKFWEKFSAGMPQTGSRRQYDALGTEWKDHAGNKSFIILVQMISTKNGGIFWSVTYTELEAPSAYFKNAKKAYVYSLANTEINPQWQRMMNGTLISQIRRNDAFWALKSQESAQAHQQRMAAINAMGNASRSVSQIYSDISDISHAGYIRRSDINSAGHAKTINMIGEHTLIGNQDTGEQYSVDAGSKYYWVNNKGEYFGTDNALYDPRIDNKINDAQWTKFKIENGDHQ